MTAPANHWKLGLFVVAGGAAAFGGLTWLGVRELKRAYHVAYAYFDEALTGLEDGSPVRFRGVKIGVVQSIRVAPDKKHLEVRAALYHDYLRDLGLDVDALTDDSPFPDNLRAQVVMSWVTSTSFVQVDFFPDPTAGPQRLPFPVRPNTLRTVPSTAKGLEAASREVLRELPLVASAARDLVEVVRTDVQAARLPELSRQLLAVLQGLDQQLADLRQAGTIAAATAAFESVRDTAASWRDDRGPLVSALRDVQGAAASVQRQLDAALLPDTASSVRTAAGALGEASGELRAGLEQLRVTLTAVERLATLLERDPGALLHGRGAASPSPLEGKR